MRQQCNLCEEFGPPEDFHHGTHICRTCTQKHGYVERKHGGYYTEKLAGIYLLEGPDGVYVGETTSLTKRLAQHSRHAQRYATLYGVPNTVKQTILTTCGPEVSTAERRRMETQWVAHFAQFRKVANK